MRERERERNALETSEHLCFSPKSGILRRLCIRLLQLDQLRIRRKRLGQERLRRKPFRLRGRFGFCRVGQGVKGLGFYGAPCRWGFMSFSALVGSVEDGRGSDRLTSDFLGRRAPDVLRAGSPQTRKNPTPKQKPGPQTRSLLLPGRHREDLRGHRHLCLRCWIQSQDTRFSLAQIVFNTEPTMPFVISSHPEPWLKKDEPPSSRGSIACIRLGMDSRQRRRR